MKLITFSLSLALFSLTIFAQMRVISKILVDCASHADDFVFLQRFAYSINVIITGVPYLSGLPIGYQ